MPVSFLPRAGESWGWCIPPGMIRSALPVLDGHLLGPVAGRELAPVVGVLPQVPVLGDLGDGLGGALGGRPVPDSAGLGLLLLAEAVPAGHVLPLRVRSVRVRVNSIVSRAVWQYCFRKTST